MLNISPFSYGLVIEQVFDFGTVFAPAVLAITDIRKKVMTGVTNVACLFLAIGYPTLASIPHLLVNGFKHLVAIALESDVEFKEAKNMKDLLSDPDKLPALVASTAAAPEAEAAPVEASKEAEKSDSEEESEEDMGLGLFD